MRRPTRFLAAVIAAAALTISGGAAAIAAHHHAKPAGHWAAGPATYLHG